MAPLFGKRLTLVHKTIFPNTVFALGNAKRIGQPEEALRYPPASGDVRHVGPSTTLDCRRALEVVGAYCPEKPLAIAFCTVGFLVTELENYPPHY